MTTTIKPIETMYNGCRFRSRLEARWAVFFDAVGVEWRYELEGYELPSGRYLPDFWLPQLQTFYEVKGCEPTDAECLKASQLMEMTSKRTLIAWGDIPHDIDEYGRDAAMRRGQRDIYIDGQADFGYAWCTCPRCGTVGIEFDARGLRIHWTSTECPNPPRNSYDKGYSGNDPKIVAGYAAARAARFEFGETPVSQAAAPPTSAAAVRAQLARRRSTLDLYIDRIMRAIRDVDTDRIGMSQKAIEAIVQGQRQHIRTALDVLVADGRLRRTPMGSAYLYTQPDPLEGCW